jgi:hypothetical protein
MSASRTTFRIAKHLASIAFTIFSAASAHAQTSSTAALKADQSSTAEDRDMDKKGGPPTAPRSLTVSVDVGADRISSDLVSVSEGLAVDGTTQASATTGTAIEAAGGDSAGGKSVSAPEPPQAVRQLKITVKSPEPF